MVPTAAADWTLYPVCQLLARDGTLKPYANYTLPQPQLHPTWPPKAARFIAAMLGKLAGWVGTCVGRHCLHMAHSHVTEICNMVTKLPPSKVTPTTPK